MVVDGSPLSQGLIRFDEVIGDEAGQVPKNSTIVSAKLSLMTGTTSGDESVDGVALHRMLTDWNDASTWNSLTGGVSANGSEAATQPEFQLIANVDDAAAIFDVSSAVASWITDASANKGWLLRNATGTDGWRSATSEAAAADRPALEITYVAPFVLGDMDGDGDLDNFDIQPFEQALINSSQYAAQYPALTNYAQRGNADGNYAFDNFDIAAFERLLTTPAAAPVSGQQSVPEPSAGLLAWVSVFLVALSLLPRRAAAQRTSCPLLI